MLCNIIGMRDKQKLFIKEYLIDLNGTQAAIRAGYSKHSAHAGAVELLRNPNVRRELDKALQERAERMDIKADYVLKGIIETVERCKQARPVLNRQGEHVMCETEDGEMRPAYTFDSSAVLKGYELLGKHLNLFTDKIDIKVERVDAGLEQVARMMLFAQRDSQERDLDIIDLQPVTE